MLIGGLFVALVTLGAVYAQSSSSGSGFVRRSGPNLYLNGRPYRFVGLNFFQANMTRPLPNCSSFRGNRSIDRQLTLMGPGHQVLRSWFFQRMATSKGRRDWRPFDRTLAAARKHGYKVIAVLGDQWNYCEGPYKTEDWYLNGYRAAVLDGDIVPYRGWVAAVVRRYRNDPTVAIWELLNEPEIGLSEDSSVCPIDAAGVMRRWAGDVSRLIRSIDHRHLISLGTGGNGNCGLQEGDFTFVYSLPTLDVCTYHDYWGGSVPISTDASNGIQLRIDQCRALKKPIYAGEAGIDIDNVADVNQRAQLFANKLSAQFSAGVSGFVAWNWGTESDDDYEIGPGDPVLSVLKPPK